MNVVYTGTMCPRTPPVESTTGSTCPRPIKTKDVLRKRMALRKGYTLHAGATCNDGRPITESARYQEAVRLGIPIVHAIVPTTTIHKKAELWVDQYAPRQLTDVIGHKDSIAQLTSWIQSWPSKGCSASTKEKGVLLTGPPGIGKSTIAHLLAKEHGYSVTEYNASDTRSVSMLRGLFCLGVKRLRKEIVVMDEVDGFSSADRGGVGELADLIRKANVPIICIANQTPPKMKPLMNCCLVVRCSRPVKSTIANALLSICKKEGITKSKADIETMCESGGNDIRSIINHLQFGGSADEKDAMLRLDLFSATQKLMSNKRCSLNEADDFVYVDYGMVPLMVQEAYLSASRSLDEAVAAAEQVSFGDIVSTKQWKTQDWGLLPHVVHSTVATSRKVSGPCPFQIFPKLLGQNSKRAKHRRWMEEVGRERGINASAMRLDEAEPIRTILLKPLSVLKGDNKKADEAVIKDVISRMDAINLSRDQLMENIAETTFGSVDVATKIKTAFTREYNKGHVTEDIIAVKGTKKVLKDTNEEEEEEEEEEEVEYD